MIRFVIENGLSPFNGSRSILRPIIDSVSSSIYKTRDAKSVHNRVLTKLSSGFAFFDTFNLWRVLDASNSSGSIMQKQEFFRNLINYIRTSGTDSLFLKQLRKPKQKWTPKYDLIVVTEDEGTYLQLNELNCNAQLLTSENDVADLEKYDIVQVVDCSDFSVLLERLPQSVFINSIDDAYLERHLELLSGWQDNIDMMKRHNIPLDIKELLLELEPLLNLIDSHKTKILTYEEVENCVERINEFIGDKIKELTISGDSLVKILSEHKLPPEFHRIVEESIKDAGLPSHIFNIAIPVTIDNKELEEQIKRQSTSEFTNLAEIIKSKAFELKKIDEKLKSLSALILIYDFIYGVYKIIPAAAEFPSVSEEMKMQGALNIFLDNAKPISFLLDNTSKCSILTGANSGGKTTLLEHVLQNISLINLGFPINGRVSFPIFEEVYYFAKNKGSMSKGAFETLLTQMSKIRPGNKTLILADEIEAVTEPGVAGKIICATADFFIKKSCFMILATHLGYEIQKNLPHGARIDGIEAKGLDENFNLIVDHNPVLGRLAHSTPELIVERMANSHDEEYFRYLYESLK